MPDEALAESRRVTKAEACERLRRSPETLARWVRAGAPGPDAEGLYDVAALERWLRDRDAATLDRRRKRSQLGQARAMEGWNLRHRRARAKRAEFDLRVLRGQFVPKGEFVAALVGRAIEFRRGLGQLAQALPAVLAHRSEVEIHGELAAAFRRLLEIYSRSPGGVLDEPVQTGQNGNGKSRQEA